MEKLTREQQEFAEQHHTLVYRYLRIRHLPYDDYYDVAVFGYLRSVVKYLTRPDLQKYSFTTISFACMDTDVHNYRVAAKRPKRKAQVVHLDILSPSETPFTVQTPEDEAIDRIMAAQVLDSFDTTDRQVLRRLSEGYTRKEIAEELGAGRREIPVRIEYIRERADEIARKIAA